ncbi:bifunctional heptose 7-phosphate kinase/heptose 1-phosphate adenyltransferase [Kiritimatiella glycovorans]|uniref:D-glycero-beta-D-manno-heptose 7-phosphate kinase n=1 Tax=Kiritimatiella glycovorans TaxID=1307763 RepID=A0A0G3EGW5_9BACT|nr:bifunctional ADP-heptose synthase [Kiritimatiella glycovorans]AKJ64050.1 D-glycero-beta-D-manno-heptose 7-phosphate kinase [Kiritimatiella glycovorans]
MDLAPDRVREMVTAFRGRRVLAVGDPMLDRFVYGSVERISPEAPVPVVRVREEHDMPGGVGNVGANIASLGGDAVVAGLVGCDAAARDLREVFRRWDIADELLGLEGVSTAVKSRVVAERQQVVRVDRERPFELDRAGFERFCERLRFEMDRVSAVILEDYGKGTLGQDVVDFVLREASERGLPAGYDPREGHSLRVEGLALATPNRAEAFSAAAIPWSPPAENPLEDGPLCAAGEKLREQWRTDQLFVTLGPGGMLVFAREGAPRHIPTMVREVFDVSGAGDTVMAAAMLAMISGATPEETAEIANLAAGVVVGKIGTARCGPEELVEYARSWQREQA